MSPPNPPPSIALFPTLKPPEKTFFFHQISVLILTFVAYASFHASRKPPSIVKSVLGPEIQSNSTDAGWVPFNGPQGPHRLGELDLAFLASYSVGMYFAGHLGDRIDLRLFLSFGMVSSGVLTSIGWPCVVAVVGNWFGKSKRGLIMGVWSSHASVGNILGSVVASSVLEFVNPEDIGFGSQINEIEMTSDTAEKVVDKAEHEEMGLLGSEIAEGSDAIGFFEAWRLPGVAPFAFCLFFSKLVAYTFLYWLPFYIRHTAVAGVHLSHKTAGILSTIFDIGGVVGGVLAGYISDKIEARAVTSIAFLLLSIPALILYRIYGSMTMFTNIALMSLSGLLVNGPYSLITTAVAADLSSQSLGNSRALATVTAIIDGTGSVGAALGPLLAGYISTGGWNNVFVMLIVSVFCASLFLISLAKSEIKTKFSEGKWQWFSTLGH
ncbi:unnamed protein product [Rhodiola kirilowii]